MGDCSSLLSFSFASHQWIANTIEGIHCSCNRDRIPGFTTGCQILQRYILYRTKTIHSLCDQQPMVGRRRWSLPLFHQPPSGTGQYFFRFRREQNLMVIQIGHKLQGHDISKNTIIWAIIQKCFSTLMFKWMESLMYALPVSSTRLLMLNIGV